MDFAPIGRLVGQLGATHSVKIEFSIISSFVLILVVFCPLYFGVLSFYC
jgi:hypothetical protein